jgi:hypothetical protein
MYTHAANVWGVVPRAWTVFCRPVPNPQTRNSFASLYPVRRTEARGWRGVSRYEAQAQTQRMRLGGDAEAAVERLEVQRRDDKARFASDLDRLRREQVSIKPSGPTLSALICCAITAMGKSCES